MGRYSTGPETERLVMRELAAGDAQAFYTLNSHPEVMRLTHDTPLRSAEEAEQAIARYPDFDEIGYGRWGCVLKESGALIGFCGLKYLRDLDVTDVGYRFLPEHWGQGLATEACGACIAFGFDVIGLERIVAFVLPENAASIRVLEKVGFEREGEQHYDGVQAIRYAITERF